MYKRVSYKTGHGQTAVVVHSGNETRSAKNSLVQLDGKNFIRLLGGSILTVFEMILVRIVFRLS